MGVINLALWAVGVALIAVGYLRAKGPWQRYQALRAQDANIARYEAWRGGIRGAGGNDKTGASVAMQILRRQAQTGATLMVVGFLVVFLGFFLK